MTASPSASQMYAQTLRTRVGEALMTWALGVMHSERTSHHFDLPQNDAQWRWENVPRQQGTIALLAALIELGWHVDMDPLTPSGVSRYMSPERYRAWKRERDRLRALQPKRVQIDLDGVTLYLTKGDKPPKLRFQPGSYLRFDGGLYIVIGAFRTRDTSREWQYSLEERKSMNGALEEYARYIGDPPPIIYDFFSHAGDASTYFHRLKPSRGFRRFVGNQTLMQRADLLSSGDILDLSLEPVTPRETLVVYDVVDESTPELPAGDIR